MRWIRSLLILLFAVLLYSLFLPVVWRSREAARSEIPAGYTIPSKFSRILAFGHKGVLSDYLFLKIVTFVGGRSVAGLPLSEEDWQYVITGLDVVSDLDPYFADPYIFAEGLLAWEAGKPEQANRLLEKGRQYRHWDWRIPYYIGFNYFYFLQNYEKGGEYVMEAARIPGSHPFLAALGARLAYYGGKSKMAVLFLRQMLLETTDLRLRASMKKRLVALERAAELEAKIDLFVKEQGRKPAGIEELITAGYVDSLPPDPYGGQWVILKNDRVFSTSKFTDSR
jgi:tetratricopeptide (TPR) repeat protein